MTNLDIFRQFFDACGAAWVTERTYPYLFHQEVERSYTKFRIYAITPELKAQVLSDNEYAAPSTLDDLPGYHSTLKRYPKKAIE
jgi:hypothetical protein